MSKQRVTTLCQALRQQSIKGGYLRKSPNMFFSALKGQLLTHQLIRLGPIELHTDADFISYQSMCSDLDKLRCVRNDGTNCTCRADGYFVLCMGNGALICIYHQPLGWSFCSIVSAMILIHYKDFKTLKIRSAIPVRVLAPKLPPTSEYAGPQAGLN